MEWNDYRLDKCLNECDKDKQVTSCVRTMPTNHALQSTPSSVATLGKFNLHRIKVVKHLSAVGRAITITTYRLIDQFRSKTLVSLQSKESVMSVVKANWQGILSLSIWPLDSFRNIGHWWIVSTLVCLEPSSPAVSTSAPSSWIPVLCSFSRCFGVVLYPVCLVGSMSVPVLLLLLCFFVVCVQSAEGTSVCRSVCVCVCLSLSLLTQEH